MTHGTADPANNSPGNGLRVPGTALSCVLVTILTVLLAVFSGHESLDPILRAAYFAVLYAAFLNIARREPSLRSTAYRWIGSGFQVLTLGFLAAAVLRVSGLADRDVWRLLSECFERGAVFLLGVSLITYGILLSIPAIVESYRVLRLDYRATQGRLRKVESSKQHMEQHIVEADRYHAIGELAAGVAHDLRNPLTIVATAAAALRRKRRSQESIEEHCQVIERNIERAERTIAALLDLGKPRELAPGEHDIGDACREVVALVRPEARRRKIGITLRCDAEITTVTDQKLLGQALLNLLLNALQASAQGTEVQVRLRTWTGSANPRVFLAVEDRGSGLRSDDRAQLFRPFFTTKADGTGLGLLSCRRILDDLGGGIGLYPRFRGGARALLWLPIEPRPSITTTAPQAEALST